MSSRVARAQRELLGFESHTRATLRPPGNSDFHSLTAERESPGISRV